MDLKPTILQKLYRRRIIGSKHTAFEHVMSGIPKHLTGQARQIIEVLIKEGLILTKPTNYGLQISLNPERIDEIERIIENN